MNLLWSIQTLISYHTNMWSSYEDYSFHIQKEKNSDPYILTVYYNKEVIETSEFPFLKVVIMHINYKYDKNY